MNLFSLLERTARRWPEGPAVFVGQRQLQTWGSLQHRALCLAGSIGRLCPLGSRIAIFTENTPEYLELMFGAWAAAAAIVPLNYKLHPREAAQIVEDADAALVFVSRALAGELRGALRPSFAQRVVELESPIYEDLFAGSPASVHDVDSDALAWLFYTSGTTGRCKGAMLSHANLMAMTVGHLADVEAIDEGCSQIHAAPMSHGSGLCILPYVAQGARQVIADSSGFEPAEFLELCDRHPRCGTFLAPTMVQRLRLAVQAAARPFAGLRSIVYGGGPMYVEELKKSLAVFGDALVQIYGQGEAPMTITWLRREDHCGACAAILGSVGVPRTGIDVRVVDERGQSVGQGETGEVICRGAVVMSGYWNDPRATAETLRSGWLYTGDMGSFDAQGYLTLRDRSKDVVISGGSNIYPREVEEVLLKHPGVSEVCVVGERDDEWGESVVAFVVSAAGVVVNERDLDAHCLARIARFKRPKRYVFVGSLPKNSYGKVLKRALREQLHAQRPPSGVNP